MVLILLFIEFFKIGLFSFGGGYATLPFLYHMSESYHWFSSVELSQMLAISSITPGPVGLNVATFAGFKAANVTGSIVATLAIMLPSFVITVFISKLLKKFNENFYVQSALYALRPAAMALIAAVAVRLFRDSILILPENTVFWTGNILNIIDIKAFTVFLILLLISFKLRRDPLIYLLLGGIFGILLHFGHFSSLF